MSQRPSQRVVIEVKVVPRARTSDVVGWQGAALKVRVQAPPVDGKANAALVGLLAARLGLNAGAVEVVSGAASTRKRVAIAGLSREEIERRLV